MTSNETRLGTPSPCLRCLQFEIRINGIERAEAAPAALPVKWTSIACGPTSFFSGCRLCRALDITCPPCPTLMYGNTEDVIMTISYIVDTLEMRHPSNFAVAEEGDKFAHIFSRAARGGVVKALAKLGAAFDTIAISHQREHNLLGSQNQEDIEQHVRIYKDKVLARQLEMIQACLPLSKAELR